ncbi:MAG: hypothetical protein R6W69_00590 [Anaerolineales bacterium]
MQVGNVQKLISIFEQSFKRMDVEVSLERLEILAVTIHRGMTAQARHFHTLEHVFAFADTNEPVSILASLYHDIVYYQVDMGFAPHIWELISPYIAHENGNFRVSDTIPEEDRLAHLTLDVFGLRSGQELISMAVLNEFLSALVLNRQLGDLLSPKDILRMNLCIEATIPFRGRTQDGETYFDVMERRLPELASRYGIALNEDELIDTLRIAVTFGNKDIENFAESDPGRFLDNTWKLLPESNAALRLPDVYSIGTYRQALQKMAVFFQNLDPQSVFNQYRGVPSDMEYQQMLRYSHTNIEVAREYLKLKILSMTVLEALAIATGGDAPVSLFMGDVPREGVSIKRLEYFLPDVDDAPWIDYSSVIYKLLESGRSSETSFDMKNSPLSLFLYKSLSPEKIEHYMQRAEVMFSGEISADDFLMEMDPAVVRAIASASAMMVFTRRQGLLKYANLP